jgi:hypothetical protein
MYVPMKSEKTLVWLMTLTGALTVNTEHADTETQASATHKAMQMGGHRHAPFETGQSGFSVAVPEASSIAQSALRP